MTLTAATNLPIVQADSFLTLHYRMSGPSGVVVDTFDAAPATLTLGTGSLSPAIEAGLIGLEEGCRTTIELPAGAAFGPRSNEMMQWLSRKELNDLGGAGESFAVGEVVKFPTPDGQGEFAGVIQDFRSDAKGEAVLFDFNHPLAGQPVRFDVQVIGVL
jgi:FKBP-type peptidyl-prolyl cis-trans isomerase SlpA